MPKGGMIMSTKDARKNKNAQFGKQQDILPLPHISAKTLFEDKREAEKWYTLLYQLSYCYHKSDKKHGSFHVHKRLQKGCRRIYHRFTMH